MAVKSININQRVPYSGGKSFGDVGAFEQLDGIVHFAVNPSDSANALITDLALAPKTSAGLVEFSADFRIVKPVDPQKGSHKLFFDVVNRGKPLSLLRINSGPEEAPMDEGNGFLMRCGYTQVWCGWQHDFPNTPGFLKIQIPIASDANGPVSGQIAVTFQPNKATNSEMLSDRGHIPYPANNLDQPNATLTVCDYDGGPRTTVPRSDWFFGREESGKSVPDNGHIYMERGFEPGKVYQCIYTTSSAPVVGLGMASVRDLVSYLRYSDDRNNPCAGDIHHTIAFGSSQSGRFLREMLYLAMNQDEEDRMVFDGIIANIAGGRRGEFNQRFGQPSNTVEASTASLFPFADIQQVDSETGISDGLLARLTARGKAPKLFLTNTSSEYWGGHAALTHIDATGTKDIVPSHTVRIYHFAGTQHSPGVLPLKHVQPTGAVGLHPFNWVDWRPLMRAAVANLDAWVCENIPPPPSQHPRLDNGTAIPTDSLKSVYDTFPGYGFPRYLRHLSRFDFGLEEGITKNLPPITGKPYPTLTTTVDQDGNELAGIRLPDLAVPLATVTGWNLRHPDTGGDDQTHRIMGSTVPFAFTRQERQERRDPRPSVEERYASKEDYLDRVEEVAKELVSRRYLLEEDIPRLTQMAAERYELLETTLADPQPADD